MGGWLCPCCWGTGIVKCSHCKGTGVVLQTGTTISMATAGGYNVTTIGG